MWAHPTEGSLSGSVWIRALPQGSGKFVQTRERVTVSGGNAGPGRASGALGSCHGLVRERGGCDSVWPLPPGESLPSSMLILTERGESFSGVLDPVKLCLIPHTATRSLFP